MERKMAFSVAEAAEALGVSAWKVREECHTGALIHVKIGRRLVIPRWALEKRLGIPPASAD